jgi:hypothetical protein
VLIFDLARKQIVFGNKALQNLVSTKLTEKLKPYFKHFDCLQDDLGRFSLYNNQPERR